MKKYITIGFLIFSLVCCSTKDNYDVAGYYTAQEKGAILTSIITYIFIAPPYTLMKDRFKPEHRKYYSSLTSKFSLDKLFITEEGINYFYVIRPGTKIGEQRGVGGYFKTNKNYELTGFHEVFVTPAMSEEEVKSKGLFLFDKMVKGEEEEYLKMKSYVQWPNAASTYDTTKYEWVLRDEVL